MRSGQLFLPFFFSRQNSLYLKEGPTHLQHIWSTSSLLQIHFRGNLESGNMRYNILSTVCLAAKYKILPHRTLCKGILWDSNKSVGNRHQGTSANPIWWEFGAGHLKYFKVQNFSGFVLFLFHLQGVEERHPLSFSHFTGSSLRQLRTHVSHQSKIVYEFRFMQLSLLSGLKCSRKLIWKAIGIKWWFTTFMALQWFNFSQQHPDMFKCSQYHVIVRFCYRV